jgi:GcrA cell cycle regulator
MQESIWTEERIAELARLTAEALPISEIARRMGLSKNAVVGKRNRLGLAIPDAVSLRRLPPKPRVVELKRDVGGCRWPMWSDQERPTHTYCCARVHAPGEPYCSAHRERAWVGRPPLRGNVVSKAPMDLNRQGKTGGRPRAA